MGALQTVYRPGGIFIATDAINTTAAVYARIQSVPPDAAEHDVGKEAIQFHWIKFNLSRTAMVSVIGAGTLDRISFGWRPGLMNSVAIMDIQKWMIRQLITKNGALAAQAVPLAPESILMDFRAAPIVGDPACNTFEVDLTSSGATVFDAATSGFSIEYAYSWIKADSSVLNAYLRWEALGL